MWHLSYLTGCVLYVLPLLSLSSNEPNVYIFILNLADSSTHLYWHKAGSGLNLWAPLMIYGDTQITVVGNDLGHISSFWPCVFSAAGWPGQEEDLSNHLVGITLYYPPKKPFYLGQVLTFPT